MWQKLVTSSLCQLFFIYPHAQAASQTEVCNDHYIRFVTEKQKVHWFCESAPIPPFQKQTHLHRQGPPLPRHCLTRTLFLIGHECSRRCMLTLTPAFLEPLV